MIELNPEKISRLHNTNELLDRKYGAVGTASRTTFHEKAMKHYYGELLKERRKELKITQKELAERIGIERSYIAYIEQGKTDMQLSTFLNVTDALGLKFYLGV
jgi:DNA-binding XRE family transcriptional regulator